MKKSSSVPKGQTTTSSASNASSSCVGSVVKLLVRSAFVVALFAIVLHLLVFPKRFAIPSHLMGHPIVDMGDFLDDTTMAELMQLTRDFGFIPTALRDDDSYKIERDNIGEAEPYDPAANGGFCSKTYLVPTADRKRCLFPGRIDVGRHFIRSGGIDGLKESYDVVASRVQPFLRYIFNFTDVPVANKLLQSAEFRKLAVSVCPKEKQLLDHFQVNLVIQVPGQTVASHIDAPYFYHANRFQFPQWLLAAMVFSNLFADDFVDQVQVVAYYHKWKTTDGGDFSFWNVPGSPIPQISKPAGGSANSVDGSKMVHAANVYRPKQRPPVMKQTAKNELRWRKDTSLWDVVSDDVVLQTYEEDEIRFGVVYRARCFANDADLAAFRKGQLNQWSVDYVLSKFRRDLKENYGRSDADALGAYDLGLLIMDTYIKYPYSSSAIVPLNYCAIDRMFPGSLLAKKFVSWFC